MRYIRYYAYAAYAVCGAASHCNWQLHLPYFISSGHVSVVRPVPLPLPLPPFHLLPPLSQALSTTALAAMKLQSLCAECGQNGKRRRRRQKAKGFAHAQSPVRSESLAQLFCGCPGQKLNYKPKSIQQPFQTAPPPSHSAGNERFWFWANSIASCKCLLNLHCQLNADGADKCVIALRNT